MMYNCNLFPHNINGYFIHPYQLAAHGFFWIWFVIFYHWQLIELCWNVQFFREREEEVEEEYSQRDTEECLF